MLRKTSAILLSSFLVAPASGALAPRQNDPAMGRALLEHLPNVANTDQLRFTVPLPLLLRYWADQIGLVDSGSKIVVPVRAIPERWMAEVDAENARATTLTMSVRVFEASLLQPVSIRLLPESVDYSSLLLNGKEFIPYREEGWRTVRFFQPGHYEVKASISAKTGRSGNASTLSFARQPFAISTIKFSANRAVEAWIPGTAGRIMPSATGKTSGTLAVGASEQFTLHWSTPQGSALRQGTPSISPTIAWTIGQKDISAQAILDVSTTGGFIDQLHLDLPPGAEKVHVSGGDVRDFRASGNSVDIFFAGQINGRTVLSLAFDMPRPKGDELLLPEISVPQGRILDSGWVLVSNDTGGELLEKTIEGLRPAAPIEAPNQAMGLAAITPTFLYQRSSRAPKALFDLVLTTPFPLVETIADKADIEIVARPGGEEFTKVTYLMRNNRRQYLRVRMPDGARLMSVKVEGSAAQASREGDVLLVPLPKSIQTLERLLSFPIEITYCRQGEKLQGHRERKLDLPELVDVPTAVIRATAFLPEEAQINATTGTLAQVTKLTALDGAGLGYGYGYAVEKSEPVTPGGPATQATPDASEESKKDAEKDSSGWGWFTNKLNAETAQPTGGFSNNLQEAPQTEAPATVQPTTEDLDSVLARNYFESGKKAYQENRLEDAEQYLSNALQLGRGQASLDAKDLLGNVKAIKGEDVGSVTPNESAGDSFQPAAKEPTDRAYKAKASALRRNVAAQNVEYEQRQEVLIEKGLQLLESGQEEEGAKVLEDVQKLGTQLKYRGASSVGQKVQEERYASQLGEVQEKIGDNRKLKEQLKTLQAEVSQIIMNAPTPAPKQSQQEQKPSLNATISQSQPGTSSVAGRPVMPPAPVIDARRLALSVEQVAKEEKMDASKAQTLLFGGLAGNAGPAGGGFVLGIQQDGKDLSIEEENKDLRQQVAVLGKSLNYARQSGEAKNDPFSIGPEPDGLVSVDDRSGDDDQKKLSSDKEIMPGNFEGFSDSNKILSSGVDKTTTLPGAETRAFPGQPQSGRITSEDHSAEVRKQISAVRLRADAVLNKLEATRESRRDSRSNMSVRYDTQLEDEVKEIERLSYGYYNAYGNESESIKRDLEGLTTQIARGREIAKERRERQNEAATVEFDLDTYVGDQSEGNKRAIADFIASNYVNVDSSTRRKSASLSPDAQPRGGEANSTGPGLETASKENLVEVTGGSLIVSNSYNNAAVVNDALEQLRVNDGQVVTVAGRNLDRISLAETPALGALLDKQDAEGRKFAVLDEAQYQTLAQMNDKRVGQERNRVDHGIELQSQRDVIIGTANGILGETFRVTDYDSDYNTIDLNGTSLDLPTDRYLAIDNGDYITILKTNRAHNWLERGEAPMEMLVEEATVDVELPRIGQRLLFEKTFLSAGESPDMTIRYRWKGNQGRFSKALIGFIDHLWK